MTDQGRSRSVGLQNLSCEMSWEKGSFAKAGCQSEETEVIKEGEGTPFERVCAWNLKILK
jgi:hypothetical protein